MEEIQVGQEAPEFELPCVTGTEKGSFKLSSLRGQQEKGSFKLSSLRGQQSVVLAFYALDWTPT